MFRDALLEMVKNQIVTDARDMLSNFKYKKINNEEYIKVEEVNNIFESILEAKVKIS